MKLPASSNSALIFWKVVALIRITLRTLLCLGLMLQLVGCDGSMSATQIRTAQVLYDEAIEHETAGQKDDAFQKIDTAINQGGLGPDQLGEAYLLRARCHSALGDLAAAQQDLDFAEQGSPNPSAWHFTRGIYFAAKGDAAKSKAEFATARKLNPALKIPK